MKTLSVVVVEDSFSISLWLTGVKDPFVFVAEGMRSGANQLWLRLRQKIDVLRRPHVSFSGERVPFCFSP